MNDEKLYELVCSVSKEFFGKDFLHETYFNKRLRTTGGRYMLQTHRIELNPLVFEKHGMEELIGVIKHELCHYHLHLEGKGYKHRDADFRELLNRTNSPRFCSTLIERNQQVRTNKYAYQCVKCGLLYRRKIKFNIEKYRCGKCLGSLILHTTENYRETSKK